MIKGNLYQKKYIELFAAKKLEHIVMFTNKQKYHLSIYRKKAAHLVINFNIQNAGFIKT